MTKDPLSILNESRNFQLEDTKGFDEKMKKYFPNKRNYPFIVSLQNKIIFLQIEKISEIGVWSWVSPIHIKLILTNHKKSKIIYMDNQTHLVNVSVKRLENRRLFCFTLLGILNCNREKMDRRNYSDK